jgi:hypothetical protein
MVPNLMTEAINQMVLAPGLIDEKLFAWICKNKVVFKPKKPQPTNPPDYSILPIQHARSTQHHFILHLC